MHGHARTALPVLRCAFLVYAPKVRWIETKELGPVVAVGTKYLGTYINFNMLD